jgi:hypothetical protein
MDCVVVVIMARIYDIKSRHQRRCRFQPDSGICPAVSSSRALTQDSTKPFEQEGVLPKEAHVKQQEGFAYLNVGQQQEEVEEHPWLTWTHFSPGEVVSFQETRTGRWVVGSVESKTPDGLIIWIRDDLNDRRAFHFLDCESVQLLR